MKKQAKTKLELKRLTIKQLTDVAGGCGMTLWTGCVGCSQMSEISKPKV
jgi:hypothetical protein